MNERKRQIRIEKPDGFRPHGKLTLYQSANNVSWKNGVKGRCAMKFSLANNKGMMIALSEWYPKETTSGDVHKETMIEIDRDEAQAIVDHLQGWLDRTA